MYQAINKNLNKNVREREEINKIEFTDENVENVTKAKDVVNDKIRFYLNLRRAVSKKRVAK